MKNPEPKIRIPEVNVKTLDFGSDGSSFAEMLIFIASWIDAPIEFQRKHQTDKNRKLRCMRIALVQEHERVSTTSHKTLCETNAHVVVQDNISNP